MQIGLGASHLAQALRAVPRSRLQEVAHNAGNPWGDVLMVRLRLLTHIAHEEPLRVPQRVGSRHCKARLRKTHARASNRLGNRPSAGNGLSGNVMHIRMLCSKLSAQHLINSVPYIALHCDQQLAML